MRLLAREEDREEGIQWGVLRVALNLKNDGILKALEEEGLI